MNPMPEAFIHAIDPTSWLVCYNLRIQPSLSSPDQLASQDPGLRASHVSLRDTPIEELKTNSRLSSVVTPRVAKTLIPGAIVESGGHVGIGVEQTKWLSAQQEDSVHDWASIELKFEQRRREIVPDAASRLSCLWIAEDNELGRQNIEAMFGAEKFIMHARILKQSRISRVDTAWFDKFVQTRDEAFIDAYWRGSALIKDAPRWEFLLEGTLRFDPLEVAELCKRASQLETWPSELPC